MLLSRWGYVVCVAALAGLIGCTPAGGGGPETVKVTGTVTLNGQAVDGATVSFSPTSGGRAAAGVTDASGRFTLSTLETGDGAVPGSYGVTITKRSGGEAGSGPQGADVDYTQMSEEQKSAFMGQMKGMTGGPPQVKDFIPAKYGSVDTSGLTREVKRGEKNDFTFELTK